MFFYIIQILIKYIIYKNLFLEILFQINELSKEEQRCAR